jgi:DNA polymerase III alpha subunit
MKQNSYGEMIFNEDDVCNLLMQGRTVDSLKNMIVDNSVDLEKASMILEYVPLFNAQYFHTELVENYHKNAQNSWKMPQSYKDMDIAKYVLDLCSSEDELQRVGQELLLYQERNLFDLLRYLKYLVDVMTKNQLIWGVGRGSSVASYVLYKLGVHRINSMYYDLNIEEFLR